jgi:hypothetical protein
MKFALALGTALLLASFVARADTVKFQTGSWTDNRKLTWVGRLDRIDHNTGIAYFTYRRHGVEIPYRIHVSRILSFDVDNLVDDANALPETREPLELALRYDTDKKRSIALENTDTVVSELSSNLLVIPTRASNPVYLRGEITSVEQGRVLLWALDDNGSRETIAIDRRYLKQWVR